ncbi:MAG: methylated-DNA--[protein]-cysteine S-methyltransferase [Holosporales bacterium]|jgi:methylated-DNA-[protein]-cysteine S-methyltransferase|nr:methylated-DNA--[protein]-cysteine S-methyltransferase [Holosporales bacterium]
MKIKDISSKAAMQLFWCPYKTALGIFTIAADEAAIITVRFDDIQFYHGNRARNRLTDLAADQLEEYAAGKRRRFELPLSPEGTIFQRSVWDALMTIPYGETCSYKQVAEQIGKSTASLAVGMANNKNPIPIIIPCHRVVGSNGELTGYAGGLDLKNRLLALENQYK